MNHLKLAWYAGQRERALIVLFCAVALAVLVVGCGGSVAFVVYAAVAHRP